MELNAISDIWDELVQVEAAPDNSVIVIAGAIAAAAVLVTGVWRHTRHVITIAHEGGHALVAVLSGRRLRGIRLHNDTSGATMTRGRRRGPGAMLTLMAGYLAPAALGVLAALLVTDGRIVLLLWLTVVLLLAMVVFIRNWYGLLAVGVVGGLAFAATWYASADVQSAVAYGGAWFLLIGAVRPVTEVWRQRSRGQARGSDPEQLADITAIPAVVWLLFFAAATIAAMVYGGLMLLDPVDLSAIGLD